MSSVSVCMAIHKGESFLRQQIDSILVQLEPGDELVISDDDPSDEVSPLLLSYQDPRIKVLPKKHFGGPVRNFEYTLASASHDLIFLADQDDVWYTEKIKVMREKLKEVDLAICDCRLVDHQLKTISPSFFKSNRSRPGLFRNLFRSSYIGCCMAFHRRVLEKALPFPDFIQLHDQWIGLVAERYFRVSFIPQILVDHRRHHSNYSSTGGQSKNSIKKKLKLRFHLAKRLFFQ